MTMQQNITFEMLEKMAMDELASALETSKNVSLYGEKVDYHNTVFDLGVFFGIVNIMEKYEFEKFVDFWQRAKSDVIMVENNIENFYRGMKQ